jgi:hypothetical protein
MWGELDRDAAAEYCEGLDGGPWELPTIDDLRSLIDPGDSPDAGCANNILGGACGVSEELSCLDADCASGCETCVWNEGPDDGCFWKVPLSGPCDLYWSSSPVTDPIGDGWRVSYAVGGVYGAPLSETSNVRCVRQ